MLVNNRAWRTIERGVESKNEFREYVLMVLMAEWRIIDCGGESRALYYGSPFRWFDDGQREWRIIDELTAVQISSHLVGQDDANLGDRQRVTGRRLVSPPVSDVRPAAVTVVDVGGSALWRHVHHLTTDHHQLLTFIQHTETQHINTFPYFPFSRDDSHKTKKKFGFQNWFYND